MLPLFVTSCGGGLTGKPELDWTPVDSLNARLPAAVRVFSGVDVRWPLRAWYVTVDLSSPDVHADVVMSDEADARETTSSLARDLNACVVVNGGYFRMDLDPSRHVGLLMIDSLIVSGPTPSVIRNERRYGVTRAAVGFDASGLAEIGWVSSADSILLDWSRPRPNMPDKPGDTLDASLAHPWNVVDALSGGPGLVSNGKMHVTDNEEVFFGSEIPKVHPRTAVGITEEGVLILLVVDGRQIESSGVDLEDLASILLDIGATEAINLDGGGSSTLVVNGVRLNLPAGSEEEREVMSAIAVDCRTAS